MIEAKSKPCKGQNKALGFEGCGTKTLKRTFGLCDSCLYDFYTKDERGKIIFFQKRTALQKSQRKEQKAVLKEKLKTLSQYEADAKKSFQKWIRLRDNEQPCISCPTSTADLFDGGHYLKAELFSGLIFDERNCHKQCRKCNRFLNGNELQYRKGLLLRYGIEFVEQLEADSVHKRVYKFTKEELIEIKRTYDQKLKQDSI